MGIKHRNKISKLADLHLAMTLTMNKGKFLFNIVLKHVLIWGI